MSDFIKQAELHNNLCKLACAARYIRRKRAQQKRAAYKQALSGAERGDLMAGALGAGVGGLLGGGLGYGLGGKNKKLMSTLIGAGLGAGVGGAGGYGLNRYVLNPMANISDKALAKDLRNLQGQGFDQLSEFGKRLNDAKLEGDDLYAANKAYNKALGQAVRQARKEDSNFVIDKALYRPEMEGDLAVKGYGVGSKRNPTGYHNSLRFDVQPGTHQLTRAEWRTNTPDQVLTELEAMQRAEAAGNLPAGSAHEAAQAYYNAMSQVDPMHRVMGGSAGIRAVGVDSQGRPLYNVPTKDLPSHRFTWWKPQTWGAGTLPTTNVYYDAATGEYRANDTWGDNEVPIMPDLLQEPLNAPEGGVSYDPILKKIRRI